MENILERCLEDVVSTALTLVLTVLVPYALLLARRWVAARTAQIEDKRLREGIEFALDRLDKTTETVVREIGQVLVQRVDGRVIKPELMQQTAVTRVLDRLPPAAMRTLQELYDHQRLTQIVRGKIESKIKPA